METVQAFGAFLIKAYALVVGASSIPGKLSRPKAPGAQVLRCRDGSNDALLSSKRPKRSKSEGKAW